MNKTDFDRAVTATLDAAIAASVASTLTADLAAALIRADRTPPSDLEAIVRCSLCPDLEPEREPAHSRDRLAALVSSLDRPDATRPVFG